MMNKNMLKQAQQMQAKLAAVQDEIAVARIEATAGGGVVKVTVIGGSSVESTFLRIGATMIHSRLADALPLLMDMATRPMLSDDAIEPDLKGIYPICKSLAQHPKNEWETLLGES